MLKQENTLIGTIPSVEPTGLVCGRLEIIAADVSATCSVLLSRELMFKKRSTPIRTNPSVATCIHRALNLSRFAYISLYSLTLATRSVDVARCAGSIRVQQTARRSSKVACAQIGRDDAAWKEEEAFSSDVNNASGAYITPDQIAALRLVVTGSG